MKNNVLKVGLVSVSDRASQGVYPDKGIPALEEWFKKALLSDYELETAVIPDEKDEIRKTLIRLCDESRCDLILTTGGTGPARRDVTPDVTLEVATRVMPGFGEQMRNISLAFVPTAILSRQAGVLRETEDHAALILNLPGQPKSIAETLEGLPAKGISGIFAAVPYCIELIGGPSIETRPEIVRAFRPKSAALPFITDCLVQEPEEGKADSTLIMLHGLGADADDFEFFGRQLFAYGAPLQHTRVICPRAPYRNISIYNEMPMRGWYDIQGLEDGHEGDEEGILGTWKMIERLIAQEETRGIKRHRIMLGGFSQGGCMSLLSACKLTLPIGAVFALSSYLPALKNNGEVSEAGLETPIFIGYGDEDQVVPAPLSLGAASELRKLGAKEVEVRDYPGMDHSVCEQEITDLADFLCRVLKD